MHIKTIPVGPIETNCYIVTDEMNRKCAIVDPGDEASRIMDYVEGEGLTVECVLLTHAHDDHIGAVDGILEETGATLYMSEKDNSVPIGFPGQEGYSAPDGTVFYGEGDTVKVGALEFRVIETPGHTPGSVCLICEDAIFAGDTLFRGSCGRTDFVAGDQDEMMKSLKRLGELSGEYGVFPGHMASTSLNRERQFNYFMVMAMND